MALPGSLAPHARFRAEAYVLTPEEGGRHKPFFTNYRPQFYFQTSDIAGMITLPTEIDMVMPGDSTAFEVSLIEAAALEPGQRFAIREGSRTVGHGVVAEILG